MVDVIIAGRVRNPAVSIGPQWFSGLDPGS